MNVDFSLEVKSLPNYSRELCDICSERGTKGSNCSPDVRLVNRGYIVTVTCLAGLPKAIKLYEQYLVKRQIKASLPDYLQ